MKSFIKKFIPKSILKMYYAFWPFLGAVIYRFPSKKIKVIGVTGTNGKTSVVHLATHILENSGYKVASISSLRFKIGNKEWKNILKMTMPGRMKVQRFLKQAVNADCEFVVIEVTSEGIKQFRHKHIQFDTVVFTNLTKEHIESHGSFENYKKTKGKLFALPHRLSIVNIDDENAEYFLSFPAHKKIGYGLSKFKVQSSKLKVDKEIIAENIKIDSGGVSFQVNDTWFHVNLMGEFNIYNSLAAILIAKEQGIDLKKIKQALSIFSGMSGRMEIVIKKPYKVIVDYAHTPDALEKVYKTIFASYKLQVNASSLICVLGAAGGGRDKWKRPEFGRIAARYCSKIILTDEDPYDENPEAILEEIEKGFSLSSKYQKILNRRQAIRKALQKAKEGDIVVITGKGAEPLMMTKNGSMVWDDREVVREEYKKLTND